MNSIQLREKRAALVNEMNYIVAAAQTEGRSLNAEENQKFDAIENDVRALGDSVEKIERAEQMKKEIAAGREARAEQKEITKHEAFSKYLRHGLGALNNEERSLVEQRGTDPQLTTPGSAGGFLVPEDFSNILDVASKFTGEVERLAQVLNTQSGATLPYPKVDDTSVVGAILSEGSADVVSDMTFASLNLGAYTYSSKIVKVSYQLLQDAAFDLDAFLVNTLGERIARGQNAHFTTGDGSSKPTGIITAGSSALTTASATAITADEILTLIHSVDKSYRNSASFALMGADSTAAAIRKLGVGSSNDFPVFIPGMAAGEPDRVFGVPFYVNNDMAAIASANKPLVAADFSKYVVRNAGGVQMLRLNERYADALLVGFIAYKRSDAGAINGAAIKYITMKTAA
jgi:HK97 family phage major capsid protein